MSQLTAVRNASRTVIGAQWWHLSTFAGGSDVADGIIGELVTPLAAQARILGASRWYFTRREEPTAARVTVHILASPQSIERLKAFHRALQARPGSVVPRLGSRQHLSATASTHLRHIRQLDETGPQLEADLVKYGGVEGLRLAEEVFELSSEMSAWATHRFVKMQNRSALGALLLVDSARSMMKGSRSAGWPDRRRLSWDFYWDSHLRTCTADLGPRSANLREAMAVQVNSKTPAFHGLMAATAAESAVQNWRRRWFRALDTYLHRADKSRVSRSAQHLTVYQAHMTLNRLGFTSREEGALGLYARSWNVENEKAVLSRS